MEPGEKFIASGDGRVYFIGQNKDDVEQSAYGAPSAPIHGHSQRELDDLTATIQKYGGDVVDLDKP